MILGSKWFVVMAAFVAFTALAAEVCGADFRSDKGYSLSYPDDWKVATKEDQKAIEQAANQLVKNVDFSRIDAMIFDPRITTNANVNVVVVDRAPTINDQAVSQVRGALQQQFAMAGLKLMELECNRGRIGGNDAIVSTWRAEMPMGLVTIEMKQKQVILNGSKQSYVITCTSSVDRYADTLPVFDGILDSFKPDKGGWSSLPSFVRSGIIGGGIGGAVGALAYFFRKQKQA